MRGAADGCNYVFLKLLHSYSELRFFFLVLTERLKKLKV